MSNILSINARPGEPRLKEIFYLLRYLKNNPTMDIFLSKNPDCTIRAHCDLDCALCPNFRRLVSGYLVLLGSSPFSQNSKKQDTVSLSSTEAEYRSLRKVVGELSWLCRVFTEFIIIFSGYVTVLCDNQSAIHSKKFSVS